MVNRSQSCGEGRWIPAPRRKWCPKKERRQWLDSLMGSRVQLANQASIFYNARHFGLRCSFLSPSSNYLTGGLINSLEPDNKLLTRWLILLLEVNMGNIVAKLCGSIVGGTVSESLVNGVGKVSKAKKWVHNLSCFPTLADVRVKDDCCGDQEHLAGPWL